MAPTLSPQLVLPLAPTGLCARQCRTQLLQLLLVLQVCHAQLGTQSLNLREQAAPIRQMQVFLDLLQVSLECGQE